MGKIDAVLKALRSCQRKLRQLKAGDQLATGAEPTFTELADAVEKVLEERRRQPERRTTRRSPPERRKRKPGAA